MVNVQAIEKAIEEQKTAILQQKSMLADLYAARDDIGSKIEQCKTLLHGFASRLDTLQAARELAAKPEPNDTNDRQEG